MYEEIYTMLEMFELFFFLWENNITLLLYVKTDTEISGVKFLFVGQKCYVLALKTRMPIGCLAGQKDCCLASVSVIRIAALEYTKKKSAIEASIFLVGKGPKKGEKLKGRKSVSGPDT